MKTEQGNRHMTVENFVKDMAVRIGSTDFMLTCVTPYEMAFIRWGDCPLDKSEIRARPCYFSQYESKQIEMYPTPDEDYEVVVSYLEKK